MHRMPPLYPLRFHPVFKRYLWGGRRLGTVLGKPIGPGDDFAESWEAADHPQGQSVVVNGNLAGTTLHELVTTRGEELLGRHAPQERFPLLFKYLDCHQDLSVQVHPDDEAAAKLTPPDYGKTEAWLVLDAAPGSRLYAGLRAGFDRFSLEREVLKGRTELCLNWFEPAAGQCFFLPAGTLHALGAGLLVAEIQQASDTTYRLFDWNRVGAGGTPRPLHVEEALNAIDYSMHRAPPQAPLATEREHVTRLVSCEKFVMDRWELTAMQTLGGDQRCHLVSVLAGEVLISAAGASIADETESISATTDEMSLVTLLQGQTALIPACLPPVAVAPRQQAVMLDMYLP